MLNKVIIQGRLTSDPEMRMTQKGTPVCGFTLAVDRPATNGEKVTDFIECVAWQKTADFICKWFFKGQLMLVSGHLQVRSWEDKNGQKRKSTEVIAEEAHFCESKRDTKKEIADQGEFTVLKGDESDLPF